MTYQFLEQLVLATAEGVRPTERLTVSQAAEKYRYLNNPGSFVGYWSNAKTPYLVEPMDTLTSTQFTGMAFVGPARTGKSDMFFNWLTHTSICDPADIMVVHMTQATARDWSQGDLEKACFHNRDKKRPTEIGSRLVPGRQNDNVFDKKFLSGMRLLIKWPTITELSGKTIPRLWINDYDRMGQNVDGEGNPFDLTRKRAETFKRFGMCVAEASPGFPVSDPKWIPATPHEAPPCEGILAIYNRGDRRRWYWRCPQCRETFEPDFKLLSYPKSDDFMEAAEQAVLVCPHDGFPIAPDFKQELNEGGRWVKEGQVWMPDGSMEGRARRSDIASFWMKGPAAAFSDWRKLVLNYLTAVEEYETTGSEEALKSTTNLDQGLPYVSKAMQSDRLPQEIKDRAEDWGGSKEEPVVPEGTRFLVATVDVQARSFVVQVHGHGEGGDVWLVDMFKIRKSAREDEDGDRLPIDPAGHPEDWKRLVPEVIRRTYPLADGSGRRMAMRMSGCDSGGREGVTTNAYAFWRWLRNGPPAGAETPLEDEAWSDDLWPKFLLVKGEAKPSQPRIRLGYPDAQRKDRHSGARGDVPVLFINTNLMKDQMAAMLGRKEVGSNQMRAFGMLHTPTWAENWLYTQLTAEVPTPKGWMNPSGKRNEAWDLLVYDAALCLYREIRLEHIDWRSPPKWAATWDENELVCDPNINKKLDQPQKVDYDLAKLAESLA